MIGPLTLDTDVLTQDLRNCIATFPVTARHMSRVITVRLQATVDIVQAMEAGTLDNMNIGIIAVKDDFGDTLPKSMDNFDIWLNDKWITFQVRDVPDYFDPMSPGVTINLQSPHKGIS